MNDPQRRPQTQPATLTIAEMRALHRSALQSVESKRTELRLVLASRYRELVGSSEEVAKMRERAEELSALAAGLEGRAEGVARADAAVRGTAPSEGRGGESGDGDGDGERDAAEDGGEEARRSLLLRTRLSLSELPRRIHRRLDEGDVHSAALCLVRLFSAIRASSADEGAFPLAAALGASGDAPAGASEPKFDCPALEMQVKMVYLHVQTLPSEIVRAARSELLRGADRSSALRAAAALSSLSLLSLRRADPVRLVDLYYDSKARLLDSLLGRLSLPEGEGAENVVSEAEGVLSQIVRILQYDVILHPFAIFVSRRPSDGSDGGGDRGEAETIAASLPPFDPEAVRSKASRFLAAHLPLIRTKVKSVLAVIAGTTASKLGRIRQSLYDKTDGSECAQARTAAGGWEDAVAALVDVRVVTHAAFSEEESPSKGQPRFSLWSALFSNTFSSLVHSLLTASFHSVHARVVSTLRTSLARSPPFDAVLPHEAHRNALRMATDLDGMLRKVSDDAHELLVHAEEREESERRLRQSLYVQTCEIMGRLLNELRRMLEGRQENPARELIVGRLCHLLKFRLKTLPALLDPKSSPAALVGLGGGKSTGMITRFELGSSFDLADDDDDGLISFEEAMEAMESAFSGTHFHGAEMVRDTLLLSPAAAGMGRAPSPEGAAANGSNKSAPKNVTLSELALLSARGLRHDTSGPESALGTVQSSLDDIVHRCFREWARAALSPSLKLFTDSLRDCIGVACTVSDVEWRRLNGLLDKEDDTLLREIGDVKSDAKKLIPKQTVVGQVSPHVTSYLLALAAVLNRSVCPADSLPPVPSLEYAQTLGISLAEEEEVPNMMLTIRGSLLGEALTSLSRSLKQEIISSEDDGVGGVDGDTKLNKCSPSSLIQILMDVKFINRCFFERNHHGFLVGFGGFENSLVDESRELINNLSEQLSKCVKLAVVDGASIDDAISERHSRVFTSCDLFLSSLFGEDSSNEFASSDALTNGTGRTSLLSASSDSSFILNPLASSRRFVLLPIQAEKLTELQLRGKYGKKTQEEKTSSAAASSGNALGAGFGFLSSMLSTKTR